MKGQKCYKGFYRTDDPNVYRARYSSPTSTNGKLYTIDKNHYHRGLLKICSSGLHSCLYISLVNSFYSFLNENTAICIVRPHGSIIGPEHGKLCSSALYVERRLNRKEILNELLYELTLDPRIACCSLFLLCKIYSANNKNRGIFRRYGSLFSRRNLMALRNGLLDFFEGTHSVYIASCYKPILHYLLQLLVEHKIDGAKKMIEMVHIKG